MAKEKVLIVDDDQMIRWALTEALRNWGYACVEAGSVSAALAAFETDQPAAVLLDVNLPDGSGLDGLREIKRRQPDAVVIMMTGSVVVADTISALRAVASKGSAPDSARARDTVQLRSNYRRIAPLARRIRSRQKGCRERSLLSPAARRIRHRQGHGRQGDTLRIATRGVAVYRHQLRGDSSKPHRKRIVRL